MLLSQVLVRVLISERWARHERREPIGKFHFDFIPFGSISYCFGLFLLFVF